MNTPKLDNKLAMKFAGKIDNLMFFMEPDIIYARKLIALLIEKLPIKNISFALSIEISKKYSDTEILEFIKLAKKFYKK